MKLSRFWNAAIARISYSNEPKVNHRRDSQGNWYQIYDPKTDQHYAFGTEQEVRQWIEQRYYH